MVIQKRSFGLFVLLILLMALVACSSDQADVVDPPGLDDQTRLDATPGTLAEATTTPVDRPELVGVPTPLPTPVIILPAPLYLLSNGQIQRLETDGLTLTQLTQEAEPITDFDVSPVDARLIYVSGNELIEANPQYGMRIVKEAGNRLDPDNPADYITERISDPRFSPDGRQIAFGLNGIRLIDSGETTTSTLILASDPYPNPNNPPRSDVRFYVPGEWSPDGAYLMLRFSYWPEAGGLGILEMATQTLSFLSSNDPNTAICCDWAWGRDSTIAFVASDLFVYGTPGLSQVEVPSGDVSPIIQGMPSGEITQEMPMHLFRSVYRATESLLYTFVNEQSSLDEPGEYELSRVTLRDGEVSAVGDETYEIAGDILWARNGSGVALVLATMPDPLGGLVGPILWVPADGAPSIELPAVGERLRWGPSATAPVAIEAEDEQTDDDDERDAEAPDETDEPFVTATVSLNVRGGPSITYPVVGELLAGERALITGVSPDDAWWQIVYPPESDTRAWVTGDPDLTRAENAAGVLVVTPPPLPRPVGRIFFSASGPDGQGSILAQSLAPGAAPDVILPNASQPSLYRDSGRLAMRSSRSDLLGIGLYDLGSREIIGVSSHQEDSLPRWNPAGDRLVFASTRHGDRRWRIYTAPASGNQTAQELTFGLDPDWHPTDNRIVYKGCDDTGERCGLWLMDSNGDNRSALTQNQTDSRPIWSPDGRTVVFMSESRHNNWEVYSIDMGSALVTRLTDDGALDGLPTISPDGSRVAFVSNRAGEWGIWVVPITGGNAQRVITIGRDLPNWLEQGIDWAE
jgi:Tol biopolymer transport system component